MSVDPWDERHAVMHGPTPTPQPSGSLGQSRLLGHEVGPGSAVTVHSPPHPKSGRQPHRAAGGWALDLPLAPHLPQTVWRELLA